MSSMDTSSTCSDPYLFRSNFQNSPLSESDACTRQGATHSDGETIILASSRPKKRAGRKKFKETRHPVYRGIRRRNTNKWVCELREPNKKSRIWLGTYPTAEMAARAHDVAALALKGQLACLNFADSVWKLPVPVSKDAKDIRSAAVEAAEAFRPSDHLCNDNTESRVEEKILSDGVSGTKVCHDGASSSNGTRDNVCHMDEEEEKDAIFDMQGLILGMADGPLLSPPPCLGARFNWDDVETEIDVSLWTY
ncbi:hypothetical protein HYC85_026610 [Camellia sinensis]|uniref:AP2/ERF domain-containing protein n=1 Tax=Camellia sinensis TaxID=4442 RepID=A0A7J7G691_CAMSI|nr:hypothetical protein HYC85_026610 [Camellia sinensis]